MSYDAIVIGGGPGGSCASTFLARAGKKVLVLEKEHFPRFHIGESLLPYNQRIFREMGVLPELENQGFPIKHGAQFHLGTGAKEMHLKFANGCFTKEPMTFQVERAKFDDILLKHSAKSGTEVREGWTVTNFSSDSSGVTVDAKDESGKPETFRGAFLIDASGRNNFTGNQEGLRVIDPRLKKLAVFAHFENVARDAGEKSGDILIVRLANQWFWIIPISATKTSVGVVMDKDEYVAAKQAPEEIFNRFVQSSPPARERMKGAKRVGEFHTTTDFSYHNRRLVGNRLLRVGDAAGFMDPIFSAGVFLAMNSGQLAANLIIESLAGGHDGSRLMRAYEKKVDRAMNSYWKMVEKFYTTPFMEVFLEPREKFKLVSAVTAVLAGELEGGWKIWWRREMFFLIVRLQRYFPLLPRISFD